MNTGLGRCGRKRLTKSGDLVPRSDGIRAITGPDLVRGANCGQGREAYEQQGIIGVRASLAVGAKKMLGWVEPRAHSRFWAHAALRQSARHAPTRNLGSMTMPINLVEQV
jgi:hypothetical protein